MIDKVSNIKQDKEYSFPWGFHLGTIHSKDKKTPLYTGTDDGGFCLLYDKISESKADRLLESLCLEMLAKMPHGSLKVDMFDFGKKRFYALSSLQAIELFYSAYTPTMAIELFERLEKMIVSRHSELLCCNRPSITEHNKKSKLKEVYHLVLINLENFPDSKIESRRIRNFVESAYYAGVYLIAFGYKDITQSKNQNIQSVLNYFKQIRVVQGEFDIPKEVFEFTELLREHRFEALALDKREMLETIFANADIKSMLDPENIKLETDTKV